MHCKIPTRISLKKIILILLAQYCAKIGGLKGLFRFWYTDFEVKILKFNIILSYCEEIDES